jgi:hypothetical protein
LNAIAVGAKLQALYDTEVNFAIATLWDVMRWAADGAAALRGAPKRRQQQAGGVRDVFEVVQG